MQQKLRAKRSGTFFISPEKEIYGELTIARAKSLLYLHDEQFFDIRGIRSSIKGVLLDQAKVSLIDCVTTKSGSKSGEHGGYHYANLFPHFVLEGERHIDSVEKTIDSIYFEIDDGAVLFYDFDAFGRLIDARPFIGEIAQAHGDTIKRQIPIGPDPAILFFSGRREISAAETSWGTVLVSHYPGHDMGGPNGVRLDNRIGISITFRERIAFPDAIFRVSRMLEFLGLLVGRPQNLKELCLEVGTIPEEPVTLKVHWSTPPRRKPSIESREPDAFDVLLDAVRHPEEFSQVLPRWLDRQPEWNDARFRFFSSFAKQRFYDIDRLTGAANMFDVLPNTAVPPDVDLATEVLEAKESAKSIFRRLPPSPERDSVLGVLGRMGKSSLKRKIRHRSEWVIKTLGGHFQDLDFVTDEAVNCRNYYVHGSEPRFEYNRHFNAVIFFVDTLEFVFAASDLIEAGWDAKAWSGHGTAMSHPFGRYLVAYAAQLQMLKALLS